MFRAIKCAAIVQVLLVAGCANFTADRYSPQVGNLEVLRKVGSKPVGVAAFSSTQKADDGQNVSILKCRGAPISPPDNATYAKYVQNALINELQMGSLYDSSSPRQLSGNLDFIDLDSINGNWRIQLTVKSNNGAQYTVEDRYKFRSNVVGDFACNQTSNALMPAVQNIISKVIQHAQFSSLLR